jgi:MFS family permease
MTEDTRRNRRLWTVVVFLSVATMGAVLQVRGAVLPRLATDFGTPEWQLGLVAPAGTVGTLVVLLVVGLNAGRLDVRRSILAGLVGTALALLAMGLAPTFVVFLGAIVVRGAMNGVVRALARPLLSHFYATSRGRVYNYYDMVWAVGAAAGPLGVVAAVALGSWRLVYAGLAGAVLVVAVLSWRLEVPSVTSSE